MPRLFLIGSAPAERQIRDEDRARILRAPGPGQTVCPYTGHTAEDDEFVHFADIEAIKRQIGHDAVADVSDWLGDLARDFNRRQPRDSIISMTLEHKPSRRARPVTIREDLLRDLSCDVCRRSYGVYAIALFCPDCGAPNLALHFRREITLVHEQLAIAAVQDRGGHSELAYRLLGNAHEDVLTAFETTLKAVYRHLARRREPDRAAELCSKKAVGTAFQSIKRGGKKFAEIGIDPYAVLSQEESDRMAINIEKRHVIGHNLAVADEQYVALTQVEQPGETVHLVAEEIGRFADTCLRVITTLEGALLPTTTTGGRCPPASASSSRPARRS
ncbi:MAG: hypothetical protein OXH52_12235 [Gammaproteobacteria bacterium]|nr:hypothetical protein [Gammaproteobacteria bacterium]